MAVANEPRFAEMPPARIVPALADEGIYIGSESSFHRVLRAHGQMNRRGRARPPRVLRLFLAGAWPVGTIFPCLLISTAMVGRTMEFIARRLPSGI